MPYSSDDGDDENNDDTGDDDDENSDDDGDDVFSRVNEVSVGCICACQYGYYWLVPATLFT